MVVSCLGSGLSLIAWDMFQISCLGWLFWKVKPGARFCAIWVLLVVRFSALSVLVVVVSSLASVLEFSLFSFWCVGVLLLQQCVRSLSISYCVGFFMSVVLQW
ncbi:hypothetical protein L1049_010288 [Liquidambar formosana]|uniref:Uncharacterized protein n=1 Tax=Liquidambar formosana TaxID=63359 RepID=A0AAP0R1R8_LIQFO